MTTLETKSTASNEEVVFYIDLSTDFIKEKRVRKAIEDFIDEYNEMDKEASYGLALFKKNKDIFSIFDEGEETIIDTISEVWDEREEGANYFENGLYYILAYIFQKSRSEPKIYRIIVLSDRPSEQSEDYHTALYDLILKSKTFNTFIDIIRIGDKKFYPDDVKLRIIASETFGGVLYCRNSKELSTYLNSLTKSREEYSFELDEVEEIVCENLLFYERLATDLISLTDGESKVCSLCEGEQCQICEDPKDIPHKCYNCGICFHNCCIAKFSAENNIGVPYIFRCPDCGALLKIDNDLITPFLEKEEEKQEEFSFLIDKEVVAQKEANTKEHVEEEEEVEPKEKKIKVGGFFGNEIILDKKTSSDTEDSVGKEPEGLEIQEINDEREEEKEEEEESKISITTLNPPKSVPTIKFCPLCGESVKGSKFCPKCGSKLE